MLALLHTSAVHVAVFDALRDAGHPGLELRHHVDAGLLERARCEGPEAVADAVAAVLRRAVAEGARAVLCTCSTIGGVAEAAAAGAGVPVLRVDRPMAAAAVAAGPRVLVLAALESTLAPTAALIAEEARRADRPVEVRTLLVEGAWSRFEAGDGEGYLRRVAEAADAVTGADVIVLAQASMAPARKSTTARVPVLASPEPGLAAGAAARGDRPSTLGHPDAGVLPAGEWGGGRRVGGGQVHRADVDRLAGGQRHDEPVSGSRPARAHSRTLSRSGPGAPASAAGPGLTTGPRPGADPSAAAPGSRPATHAPAAGPRAVPDPTGARARAQPRARAAPHLSEGRRTPGKGAGNGATR